MRDQIGTGASTEIKRCTNDLDVIRNTCWGNEMSALVHLMGQADNISRAHGLLYQIAGRFAGFTRPSNDKLKKKLAKYNQDAKKASLRNLNWLKAHKLKKPSNLM